MINTRVALTLLSLSIALSTGCHSRKAAPAEDPYRNEPAPTSSTPDGGITSAEVATLHRNFRRVLFDFDTAILTAEARSALQENAVILGEHPEVVVRIEGHTDHYGSDEYNLALGQRRAQSVVNYLMDLEVGPDQLQLISYGKEKTLVPPSSKEAEAVNRRAEFVVLTDGSGAVSSSTNGDMTFQLSIE